MPKQRVRRINSDVSVNVKGTVLYVDHPYGNKEQIIKTILKQVLPKEKVKQFESRKVHNNDEVEFTFTYENISHIYMTVRPEVKIVDGKVKMCGLKLYARVPKESYQKGRGVKEYMKATLLFSNANGINIDKIKLKFDEMFYGMESSGERILVRRREEKVTKEARQALHETIGNGENSFYDNITLSHFSTIKGEYLFSYNIRNITKEEATLVSNLVRNTLGVGKSER